MGPLFQPGGRGGCTFIGLCIRTRVENPAQEGCKHLFPRSIKMNGSWQQKNCMDLISSQTPTLFWLGMTCPARAASRRVLCRGIEVCFHYFNACDEHSANFASITELVFLRMILQHTGESPGDIAGASLHEVHKHGPKIRTLPERIKLSTNTSS